MTFDIIHVTNLLLESAVRGAIAGVAAFVMYLVVKNWNERGLKFRLAEMLSLDIIDIIEKLNSRNSRRFSSKSLNLYQSVPLSRPKRSSTIGSNIYDGLVSSTNISNFDINLQRKIHTFYNYVKEKNYELLSDIAVSTLDDIEKFRDQNAPTVSKIKNDYLDI